MNRPLAVDPYSVEAAALGNVRHHVGYCVYRKTGTPGDAAVQFISVSSPVVFIFILGHSR